jgi:hypothetical protein
MDASPQFRPKCSAILRMLTGPWCATRLAKGSANDDSLWPRPAPEDMQSAVALAPVATYGQRHYVGVGSGWRASEIQRVEADRGDVGSMSAM